MKLRRMSWAGHVERMEKRRGVYRISWRNLEEIDHWGDPGVEGRTILGRNFRKWDRGIDLIDLVQDRDRWRAFLNAAMNVRFPENAGNFLTGSGQVGFSRRTVFHGVSKYISK
jgi:hypothetical protein